MSIALILGGLVIALWPRATDAVNDDVASDVDVEDDDLREGDDPTNSDETESQADTLTS